MVTAWTWLMAWYPNIPDSKVHGANMGPIWDRQDPGGPHVGPMDLAIWDSWQVTATHLNTELLGYQCSSSSNGHHSDIPYSMSDIYDEEAATKIGLQCCQKMTPLEK